MVTMMLYMLKVMAVESDGLDSQFLNWSRPSSSVKWGQQSLDRKHVSSLSAMTIGKDSNNEDVKTIIQVFHYRKIPESI